MVTIQLYTDTPGHTLLRSHDNDFTPTDLGVK